MSEVTIEELEKQRAEAKVSVDTRDMILKLTQNFEFRKIIDEGFIRDEAARNARLAGQPGLSELDRNNILNAAMAAGHLQRYLSANIHFGTIAENTIRQIDEVIAEMRAEG